jgi:hypothetical protein
MELAENYGDSILLHKLTIIITNKLLPSLQYLWFLRFVREEKRYTKPLQKGKFVYARKNRIRKIIYRLRKL